MLICVHVYVCVYTYIYMFMYLHIYIYVICNHIYYLQAVCDFKDHMLHALMYGDPFRSSTPEFHRWSWCQSGCPVWNERTLRQLGINSSAAISRFIKVDIVKFKGGVGIFRITSRNNIAWGGGWVAFFKQQVVSSKPSTPCSKWLIADPGLPWCVPSLRRSAPGTTLGYALAPHGGDVLPITHTWNKRTGFSNHLLNRFDVAPGL